MKKSLEKRHSYSWKQSGHVFYGSPCSAAGIGRISRWEWVSEQSLMTRWTRVIGNVGEGSFNVIS